MIPAYPPKLLRSHEHVSRRPDRYCDLWNPTKRRVSSEPQKSTNQGSVAIGQGPSPGGIFHTNFPVQPIARPRNGLKPLSLGRCLSQHCVPLLPRTGRVAPPAPSSPGHPAIPCSRGKIARTPIRDCCPSSPSDPACHAGRSLPHRGYGAARVSCSTRPRARDASRSPI